MPKINQRAISQTCSINNERKRWWEAKQREQEKKLNYLLRVNQEILSRDSLSSILQYIIEEGIEILRVEAAFLRLVDSKHKKLVIKVKNKTSPSDSVSDSSAHSDSRSSGSPSPGKLRPFLTLPLKAKNKTLGTLSFYNKNKRKFGFAEMQMAKIIASQSTLALANRGYIEKITKVAAVDKMTGLYNQNHFYQRLEEEIARAWRNRHPLSLLFMDADKLKDINDSCGHLTGDKVLQFIAKSIKTSIRKMDIAFRYGGDEFVVILPGVDPERASLVAERIRKKIKENACVHKTSLSLGIASFPEDAQKPRQLLDKADKAMYQAKGKGGDRVEKVE